MLRELSHLHRQPVLPTSVVFELRAWSLGVHAVQSVLLPLLQLAAYVNKMAFNVDFENELIDSLYINAAIYEMNAKTEEGFDKLSKHISDLYTFISNVSELVTKDTYQPQELVTLMKTGYPKMDRWPAVPQMLPVLEKVSETGKTTKKRGRDVSDGELITKMRSSLITDTISSGNVEQVPAPMNDQDYNLIDLQKRLERDARVIEIVDNLQLRNVFNFGLWLLIARQRFKEEKSKGQLAYWSNNFIDWVNEHCGVRKTRAYDYMKFTERFTEFPLVLKSNLPFHWFHQHGHRVSSYIQANSDERTFWTQQ